MKNFDSQDKTLSMIEKITFSASEKGVGKKLMFQSWRCGFGKGNNVQKEFFQQEELLCIFCFSRHMSRTDIQDT